MKTIATAALGILRTCVTAVIIEGRKNASESDKQIRTLILEVARNTDETADELRFQASSLWA